MRQVRYDSFGGIEKLWVDNDARAPEAAPGTVVVRLQASCLNPGMLSALHGSAYVPIRDLAGTVTAVGENVEGITFGDEVLGWAQDWSAHANSLPCPRPS